MPSDFLSIRGLRVDSRIGAGDEERASPQQLAVDIEMTPGGGLRGLGDDLAATIDYHAVAIAVRELAATGERRLIETLAGEILALLRGTWGAAAARVRIRKFILPETDWVGVELADGIAVDKQPPTAALSPTDS
jgi:dihydroneopterin aldolase